jgi:hypothetical protein
MSDHYYRVGLNPERSDVWFIEAPMNRDGDEIDPRLFTQSKRWRPEEELFSTRPSGEPARFALGEFDCPIVDSEVGRAIASRDEHVQLIPLSIGSSANYAILNALRLVRCIDEQGSEFERFTKASSRPDLTGQFKVFYQLRLDRRKIPADAHIFRLTDFTLALIISEEMKQLLHTIAADDGISFDSVA